MKILNALKGIGGEYEVQRVLGAVGTLAYTVTAPAFVATGVIKDVSFAEFCAAFPFGLASCIGATAGAIAWKDKAVAAAKVTESTGAIPAPPPAGPRAPAGELAQEATGESA